MADLETVVEYIRGGMLLRHPRDLSDWVRVVNPKSLKFDEGGLSELNMLFGLVVGVASTDKAMALAFLNALEQGLDRLCTGDIRDERYEDPYPSYLTVLEKGSSFGAFSFKRYGAIALEDYRRLSEEERKKVFPEPYYVRLAGSREEDPVYYEYAYHGELHLFGDTRVLFDGEYRYSPDAAPHSLDYSTRT